MVFKKKRRRWQDQQRQKVGDATVSCGSMAFDFAMSGSAASITGNPSVNRAEDVGYYRNTAQLPKRPCPPKVARDFEQGIGAAGAMAVRPQDPHLF